MCELTPLAIGRRQSAAKRRRVQTMGFLTFRRILAPLLLAGAVLLEPASKDYRLPDNVVPLRYDLDIWPDLQNDTFDGRVLVEIQVLRKTDSLTLHIRNLEIEETTLTMVEKNDKPVAVAISNVSYNTDTETFTVHLQEELEEGHVYVLTIGTFRGVLNSGTMVGFYSSTYMDKDGEERKYAMTDFEPTDARAAFPCFDEPALKARFVISIVRPENYTSVSNQVLESTTTLAEDFALDIYRETPLMSTYLVAFGINDFSVATLGDRYRIFGRPVTVEQNGYDMALRTSREILEGLENITGIAYPLEKLDQVAVPENGFLTGAMENWGLINHREIGLFCTKSSNDYNIQLSTAVIAHEIVHQWFGNLVSPQWWDSIWLNEGFARFFQYYVVSKLKPSWRFMDQYIVSILFHVLSSDNDKYYEKSIVGDNYLKKEHGTLMIYNKGSAVINMMRQFLTDEVFVDGLREYLDEHKYSSVNSSHLFYHLNNVASRQLSNYLGNLTVEEIMNNWIYKPGSPVVTVIRNYESGSVTFTQERFSVCDNKQVENQENDTVWHIPVNYAYQTDNSRKLLQTTPDFWLSEKSAVIEEDSLSSQGWLLVNLQQSGFYRVNYDEDNWARLTEYLKSDQFENIPVLNRAQLLNDAFHLAKAGVLNYSVPLKLSTYLFQEYDYIPIYAFITFKDDINNHFWDLFKRRKYAEISEFWPEYTVAFTEPEDFVAAETSQNFFIYLLRHVYERLGVTERFRDTHLEKLCRPLVLNLICHSVVSCRAGLLREFERVKARGNVGVVSRNMQYLVFCEAAQLESGKSFLLQLYSRVKDYFVRQRIAEALKCYQFSTGKFISHI